MKKLTPEEALAKVEAFHKAAGAVVEVAPAKAATNQKGVGSDSFVMPAAKAVEVVEEVVELTPTPEVAAKNKKTAEK